MEPDEGLSVFNIEYIFLNFKVNKKIKSKKIFKYKK